MTMTPAQIDKMLFPGACKMMMNGALLEVQQEYKRRTGKSFMASFSIDTLNEMFSGAGMVSKEIKEIMSQSENMQKARTHIDRARAIFKRLTGKDVPSRATAQVTYEDVTTEDLMRDTVTREYESDDPVIEGLIQEIERRDATIDDLVKRVEALEGAKGDSAQDTERQRHRKGQDKDGFDVAFGEMNVPANSNEQWSLVFGNLFNKGAMPPDSPTLEQVLRSDPPPAKKERSMFDPLFRTMDLPMQRQTQQAQPTTVESLTRRQRK